MPPVSYLCIMLQTTNLTYAYQNGPQLQFQDIHCAINEHWLLLGQSGSGKTTLLHLLAGLLSPKQGSIHIGETVLNKLGSAKLDTFRGQNIGIIFQKLHFVKALTVQQNLALAQQLAGVPVDKKRIRELLERLRIGHKSHSKPDRLSQGEQQRVAIARAIINRPKVILADEPTSALDDVNTEEVVQLLEEQAHAVQATLLVVTHDTRLKGRFPQQINL